VNNIENLVDFRRAEALREYFFIQERIDNFDGRTLLVKSWGVTTSGAGFAYAITQQNRSVILLTAISALVFWYIEALWKSYQYILIDLSGKIETFLQGNDSSYVAPTMTQHYSQKLFGSQSFYSNVLFFQNSEYGNAACSYCCNCSFGVPG
jgi:hypothetical protein